MKNFVHLQHSQGDSLNSQIQYRMNREAKPDGASKGNLQEATSLDFSRRFSSSFRKLSEFTAAKSRL